MGILDRMRKKTKEWKDGEGDPFRGGSAEESSDSVPDQGSTLKPVRRESDKTKMRLPHLLTFKRLMAGFIFLNLLFLIFGMMSNFLPDPMNQYIMWIFLLSAFLHLDYLWKTRRGGKH